MTTRLRWGILGTATIAREAVIPALRKAPYCQHAEIVAIASRQSDQAREVAKQFEIPKAHGSYESLLDDPDIDVVYLPLPNHLHVPYAIRALEAGKHVLCEKPIGLSAAEAEQLMEAASLHPHLKVMEAFMYRFHPQWQWARQMVEEGRIGTLRTIHTFFSFYEDNPVSILNHPEWGGGGLMDIGCYALSLSRFLFRAEPERVMGILEEDSRFGVDRLTSGILRFAAGTSTFTCATQLAPYERVQVLGTKGRLELETPFIPPTDQPCRAWLEIEETLEEIRFDPCDHYGIQADLFSRAILDDTPVPTPLADAVANMKAIDAIVRSGKTQQWETVR